MPVLVHDDLDFGHLVVGLVQQDDLIGVGLDGPRLAQVRLSWPPVGTVGGLAVDLRRSHHARPGFAGQQLQAA